MKKIVALVLSLVMVLGLATTAFGATATYDVYDADGNETGHWGVTYTVTDATFNVKTNTGSVEYVTISTIAGQKWIECDKADAEIYLTLAEQDGAVMYLKKVDFVNYTLATAYSNIGTACGQLPGNDAKYDYYTYPNALGVPQYFVASKTGSEAVMVGGELIEVAAAGTTVDHTWEVLTVNAKHEVTELVCDDCDAVATVYATKLAAPKGAVQNTYGWIVVNAPAVDAPETDKVESAETFDAGIAMYVGMSVMAAAGSAVVLKKKD